VSLVDIPHLCTSKRARMNMLIDGQIQLGCFGGDEVSWCSFLSTNDVHLS